MEVYGLDTNIICYAMDPEFPEHKSAVKKIFRRQSAEYIVAINPTVVYETYHTLVYKQKWIREDAARRVLSLLSRKHVLFLNQTKSISRSAIYLANKYTLGGRDSLILANYVLNNVRHVYTHDKTLLALKKIALRDRELELSDPL